MHTAERLDLSDKDMSPEVRTRKDGRPSTRRRWCADCNTNIETRYHRSKRCVECADRHDRERHHRLKHSEQFRAKCVANALNYQKRFPLAYAAHQQVYLAVLRGDLPRASELKCVDCGKSARDYDHRDYTKPLEVDPVCRGCNKRRGAAYPYNT